MRLGLLLFSIIFAFLGGACAPGDDEMDRDRTQREREDPDPDPDPEPDPKPDPDPDPSSAVDLNVRVTAGANEIYDVGGVIELEATVSNIGDLDAAPSELYVYLAGSARPAPGEPPLTSFEIAAIAAGEAATIEFSVRSSARRSPTPSATSSAACAPCRSCPSPSSRS